MASDPPNVNAPDGFEVGTVEDAVVDTESTRRVWVKDADEGKAYWFDIKEDVPLSKKNNILEDSLRTERGSDGEIRKTLSSDYYTDMLRYMVDDWFGAHEADAPGLATFFAEMSAVFEDLQAEVPEPISDVPDGDRPK